MPINASFEYTNAEAEYLKAETTGEKITCLKEVIRAAPKHKGSEKLLAQLKGRLAKLKKEFVKEGRKKKGISRGVKKSGHAQVIIVGSANSGKSSLLDDITNAEPKIADWPFTTQKPEIGTLDMEGCKIQLVELPANADREMLSMGHSADIILIIVTSLKELVEWSEILARMKIRTKRMVVLNKIEIIDKKEIKRLEGLKRVFKVSAKEKRGLEELKEGIFNELNLIRVYTKEPGKKPTTDPIILKKGSTVEDMAKKIRRDFIKRFKVAKMWGTGVRFEGQPVGLDHKLEDKNIVELYVK